jgi:NAD(P)-dependent dehydrogenase (short-subunit alcohol dehydrogenase family)
MSNMEIEGKAAIITGATGKLTRALVVRLAKAGLNCICIFHKEIAQAKKLQATLRRLKIKSLFIKADLTVPENIEKVFADIKRLSSTHSTSSGRAGLPRFAPPRILINAAAVFDKKPIEDITHEYIKQTFDINFVAAMMMTQKFVKFVRKKVKQRPIGKIINVADVIVQRPPAGFSIYCASKAALIAATKSLAKELAPDFTVNAVSPGIINWQKDITARQKKKILSHIPAGRTGRSEEVIEAVRFLIENDYITGQVINVDGGKSL